ncbi:MAG: dihydrolipoamide acetyltransferase family protein [Nakamurella sp.]
MPDVFMPRLSDTMEEGTIAQWLVAEGATVERGAIIAEIETDKAVMDLEAYDSGVLEKILVGVGQVVPIGEKIAIIGDGSGATTPPSTSSSNGAAADAAPAPADSGSNASSQAETVTAESAVDPAADDESETTESEPTEDAAAQAESGDVESATAPEVADGSQLKASPVVRSLARTHGIDLSSVKGTGPGGRIIRVDVEGLIPADNAAPGAPTRAASAPATASTTATPAAPVATTAEDTRIPLSTIRKVTAKRLSEAALVPAFQLTTVLDATELSALRTQINANLAESGVKISVTDLLIKASAIALRAHPEANAAFDGDAIIRRGHVNVGVAVALEDGLIVPVIKDADIKSLSQISLEAKALAKKARAGKLTPGEFSGGSFTISNLGMFGIDSFTAVLNPPEAAILAVGSTVDEPVVVDGEVTIRARSRLTMTVDHRVLDGAMGAAFLRDLTDLLANPLRILV